MICPFCQTKINKLLSARLKGVIKCGKCRAFVDKDGRWRNVHGFTNFDERVRNLPSQATFQRIAALSAGFSIGDQQYSYNTIVHLDFIWNHAEIQTSLNCVPTGKYHDHTSHLKIVMSNGFSFRQKAGTKGPAIDTFIIPGGFVRGTKHLASKLRTGMSPEEQCQELFIVSEIMHKATFDQRADMYVESLKRQSYFEYGKFTFYDNCTVSDGKKLFDLRKVRVIRRAYSLHFSEQASNLRQKMFGNNMVIPLTVDRDVMTSILSQLFGISFPTA